MIFPMPCPAQRGEGDAMIVVHFRGNASVRWKNGIGPWFFILLDSMSFHIEDTATAIFLPIIV
jgi:hypothetical protein